MIEIGKKHTSEMVVTEVDTALAVGSGDLPVLATPRMLALMEHAAMQAVKEDLDEGSTTVGGQIASTHLKPSTAGTLVRAVAEVTKAEGRKIEFRVAAYAVLSKENQDESLLLGEGTHLRFIVDRERFMSKL